MVDLEKEDVRKDEAMMRAGAAYEDIIIIGVNRSRQIRLRTDSIRGLSGFECQ